MKQIEVGSKVKIIQFGSAFENKVGYVVKIDKPQYHFKFPYHIKITDDYTGIFRADEFELKD